MGISLKIKTWKEIPKRFYAVLFIQALADVNTGETVTSS